MPTTALRNDQWPYNPDDVDLEEPPPARSLPDPLPVPAVPVHRLGYLDFLQYIRYSQPQQYVLDNFQRPLLLFQQSDIMDYDIWHTVQDAPDATFLTVSQAAANRVNSIVISRMFQEKTPLSTIPLQNDVDDFLPFRQMSVVVTKSGQTHWCCQRTVNHNSQQPE